MKEGFKPQPLLLELLAGVGRTPRTYQETMDAWRTSCPRFSVWEDAWLGKLVSVEVGADGAKEKMVSLTALGRTLLDEASRIASGTHQRNERNDDSDFTRNVS